MKKTYIVPVTTIEVVVEETKLMTMSLWNKQPGSDDSANQFVKGESKDFLDIWGDED